MNEKNSQKALAVALAAFLLIFYIAIMMYVFFAVLQIDEFYNFVMGIAFELIGFFFLAALILGNIISRRIKTGYFVTLVIVTLFYTILLDLLNILAIVSMPAPIFALLHLVLLFVYCLVSFPMYIMGIR